MIFAIRIAGAVITLTKNKIIGPKTISIIEPNNDNNNDIIIDINIFNRMILNKDYSGQD